MVRQKFIEMYSVHNEGKSVVAERFIRTLKNTVYKYMTSISKNMHIDKLDHIVTKCNNTYHSTIKVKPVDEKPSTYIESSKVINYQDPKFKIGDIVRISKYTKFKKVKNTVPWTYVISDLKGEEIVEMFYEKNYKNQKEFKVEKVIKTKGDKLYVKWKGYDSYFNSWIDKKDTV